jgi:hypothetical protein
MKWQNEKYTTSTTNVQNGYNVHHYISIDDPPPVQKIIAKFHHVKHDHTFRKYHHAIHGIIFVSPNEIPLESIQKYFENPKTVENQKDVQIHGFKPTNFLFQNVNIDKTEAKHIIILLKSDLLMDFHFFGSEECFNELEYFEESLKLKYQYSQIKNTLPNIDNKEQMMHLLKMNSDIFYFASDELKNDLDVVLFALKNDGNVLIRIPVQFKKEKEIVLIALKEISGRIHQDLNLYAEEERDLGIPNSVKHDKEIFIELSKIYGKKMIHEAQDYLKNDREYILQCVSLEDSFQFYKFASKELKQDAEILFTSIKNNISFRKWKNLNIEFGLSYIAKYELSLKKEFFECYEYIFLYFPQIYLFFKKHELNLSGEILHSIAMGLREINEERAISIFQSETINGKLYKFTNEAYFELGKLKSHGIEKDFERAEFYFKKCIENNFNVKQSKLELDRIYKFTLNLNEKEKKNLENCSNEKSYEIVKFITKSMDASIFLVKRKSDQEEFILKRFQVNDNDFNISLKEVLMLMQLKNEYICEISDFYVEEKEVDEEFLYYFCIIMPRYESDLSQYSKNIEMDESMIKQLIIEICYGIDFIHYTGVIHRDLKPKNIFISKDFRIKIGDFGLSCQTSMKTLKMTKCGTESMFMFNY